MLLTSNPHLVQCKGVFIIYESGALGLAFQSHLNTRREFGKVTQVTMPSLSEVI